MEPVGDVMDEGVTDVYSFGNLKAVVRYTAVPADRPCGDHTCIRDAKVGFVTDEAPSLEHAAIWLVGKASSAQQETEVRQFWAKTTWAPTAKAGWLTQLAVEGDVD
jgi:hypothetical protein